MTTAAEITPEMRTVPSWVVQPWDFMGLPNGRPRWDADTKKDIEITRMSQYKVRVLPVLVHSAGPKRIILKHASGEFGQKAWSHQDCPELHKSKEDALAAFTAKCAEALKGTDVEIDCLTVIEHEYMGL